MDRLKEILKGKEKKVLVNLSVAFIAGIVMILSSGVFTGNTGNKASPGATAEAGTSQPVDAYGESGYERELERRLEEMLGMISGAGKVKVMLTLSNGREIVVAENTEYTGKSTKESDPDGGIREIEERKTSNETIIISSKGGESEPLVLKEIEPKVEGVAIVAEGANDITVKDALTRAAHAVLGVDIHKIQILRMK